MAKKHIKKHIRIKQPSAAKSNISEKRQRHYAFGFLIGEY
jgi:hypothetical protein